MGRPWGRTGASHQLQGWQQATRPLWHSLQTMRPLPCGCKALGLRYCTLGWNKNVHVSMNICTQVYSSTISNVWAIEQINPTAALPKKNYFFCIEKMKQKGHFLGSHASCNLLSCIVYSQSIDERRLKIVLAQCSTNKFFQPCWSTAVLTS